MSGFLHSSPLSGQFFGYGNSKNNMFFCCFLHANAPCVTNCADCALLSLAIDELVSAETGSQTEREIERQAGCQFVSQSTLFARGCFFMQCFSCACFN